MLSTSQSIPGKVIEVKRGSAEVYHKLGDNGRIHVFRSLGDMNILPKRSFLYTVIVWVLRALMIYCLYFLGNSRCYHKAIVHSLYMRIGDNIWQVQFVMNPGRPVFPFFRDRGPLFLYQHHPLYSQVIQDVKSSGSPLGTSMDNGELKEFASTAKHYLDLVDEDNELPSTSSREDRIVSG